MHNCIVWLFSYLFWNFPRPCGLTVSVVYCPRANKIAQRRNVFLTKLKLNTKCFLRVRNVLPRRSTNKRRRKYAQTHTYTLGLPTTGLPAVSGGVDGGVALIGARWRRRTSITTIAPLRLVRLGRLLYRTRHHYEQFHHYYHHRDRLFSKRFLLLISRFHRSS